MTILHNEHAKERVIAKALPPPGVDFFADNNSL